MKDQNSCLAEQQGQLAELWLHHEVQAHAPCTTPSSRRDKGSPLNSRPVPTTRGVQTAQGLQELLSARYSSCQLLGLISGEGLAGTGISCSRPEAASLLPPSTPAQLKPSPRCAICACPDLTHRPTHPVFPRGAPHSCGMRPHGAHSLAAGFKYFAHSQLKQN